MLGNETVIPVYKYTAESSQILLRFPSFVVFGEMIGNLFLDYFQMARPLLAAGSRHDGFGADVVHQGHLWNDVKMSEILHGYETPDHILPHNALFEIELILLQELLVNQFVPSMPIVSPSLFVEFPYFFFRVIISFLKIGSPLLYRRLRIA